MDPGPGPLFLSLLFSTASPAASPAPPAGCGGHLPGELGVVVAVEVDQPLLLGGAPLPPVLLLLLLTKGASSSPLSAESPPCVQAKRTS